ncbi:hypothetical protein OC846_000937 [Tilletia horrida]|uniref:Uncharacterized protein n=1 Tax=Tilletia horrida TaxID=155126 RepID=A0AAN6GUQ4_9BASI|nr:hypothetical protein OC845_000847 [Tilletia horrida]KAK0556749.1 hypothetical protein OC846_000937 [Tilletia horrida]
MTDQIDSYAGSSYPLKAALHLLNDDITRAHTIAQDHEDIMTCNLVHCILHRREQDFWNSNWWCRRLDHPLLQIIHGGNSNAEAQERACRFTDECEAATKGASTACGAKKVQDLKKLQTDELITLVKWILENES